MSVNKNKILNGHLQNKVWEVVLTDITWLPSVSMKNRKTRTNKNSSQPEDDNIRYKLNTKYFNSKNATTVSQPKKSKRERVKVTKPNDEDDIRYKLAPGNSRSEIKVQKVRSKPKIKVKFWSSKKTVDAINNKIPKPKIVKVRKKVSVFPSPLYSEELVPMVTVPDDLTVQLNEDDIRDLAEELNSVNTVVSSTNCIVNKDKTNKLNNTPKRKSRNSTTQTSPKTTKFRGTFDSAEAIVHNNDNELDFFSKYVVQKLRKMDTNQRIYSENLINTVLMLGQLGKLNGKYKVSDAQNDAQ